MTDERLTKATRDLMAWWTSETQEFRDLVIDLLSGLPGSDDLSDRFGITETRNNCGWKEIDLIGNLLIAVNNSDDVASVCNAILKGDSDE